MTSHRFSSKKRLKTKSYLAPAREIARALAVDLPPDADIFRDYPLARAGLDSEGDLLIGVSALVDRLARSLADGKPAGKLEKMLLCHLRAEEGELEKRFGWKPGRHLVEIDIEIPAEWQIRVVNIVPPEDE